MIYKAFLDINILVDFFVQSRLNHKYAIEIFSLTERKLLKGYISESIISTTAWLLRKDYSTKQLRYIFAEMLELFTLLPCNERSCKEAFNSNIPDIEDSVLYHVALNHRMDYFITNDKTDFKNVNQKILPVITSPQFISLLKRSIS